MGQAMATMVWRFLGREDGNSLLCDENVDGETSDSFFGRYWQICRAIIRRLLGKGAGKPPSDPSSCYLNYGYKGDYALWCGDHDDDEYYSTPSIHHCIDIGIDEQISETEIHEVAIRVAEDGVDDAVGGGIYEIGKLPPAEGRPISSSSRCGKLGPYSWEQKILVVGDGDFSFSASLAVAFGDASNMISTSLDSFEFLMQNYARAVNNILMLTSKSCKVMHGLNATKMANHPQLHSLKFDRIVYNFPHAGFSNRRDSREAQICMHQKLVRGFLGNARKMIKDDGQIHITHKCAGFFLEWNIEKLGSSQGLRLVEESPFDLQHYPGYKTKFGYGGDANFNWRPAKTYKFQLANSPKKKRTKKYLKK